MTSTFKTTAWRTGTSYDAKWLKSVLGSACLSLVLRRGHPILTVNESSLVAVMWFLKNHTNCLYKCLDDDDVDVNWDDFYIIKGQRLEVSYHLFSPKYFDRITLKVYFTQESPYSDSVRSVFPGAWGRILCRRRFMCKFYKSIISSVV